MDGELVVLQDGKPNFYALQKLSLMGNTFRISLSEKSNPVQFVAYDILYYIGKDLTDLPLMERKKYLSEKVTEGYYFSVSRYIEREGKAFFELTKREGLEGIVAKRKDGKYHIGKRTRDWLKIKVMQDEDLLICGYQPDDEGKVKDLILGYFDEEGKLLSPAKITLFFNGVLVQLEKEIKGPTSRRGQAYKAHSPEQRILIQDHNNPIQFRNIWIRKLSLAE